MGLAAFSLSEFDAASGGLFVRRGASNAVALDSEIIVVHVHVEEAVVTPVGAPTVAANPILLAFRSHTEANDRDFMVKSDEVDLLLVDRCAIIVGVEVVGGVDTARDGSVLELSLHLDSTLHVVVLVDVVASHIGDGGATFDARITNSGRRPSAVTAHINGLAASRDIVERLIVSTRSVDKTLLASELVNFGGVSTIARATGIAVDDHLGREGDRGGGAVFVHDVESVSDS